MIEIKMFDSSRAYSYCHCHSSGHHGNLASFFSLALIGQIYQYPVLHNWLPMHLALPTHQYITSPPPSPPLHLLPTPSQHTPAAFFPWSRVDVLLFEFTTLFRGTKYVFYGLCIVRTDDLHGKCQFTMTNTHIHIGKMTKTPNTEPHGDDELTVFCC